MIIYKNYAGNKQKSQNRENENVRNIGQGEAQNRKYKRLKLCGGQAYDRSSDQTAVVAGATEDRA
jgi:hypothetical protein